MSPPSSRTLSTYSSLCCTGGNCWRAVYRKSALFPASGASSRDAALPRKRSGDIAARCPYQQSFYGHTLGEVARFIDIATQLGGEMVSEKLKRDGRQDGHDIIKRFRQHNDFVSNFLEMLRAISAGQRDDRPLAGFHLLDVVQVF